MIPTLRSLGAATLSALIAVLTRELVRGTVDPSREAAFLIGGLILAGAAGPAAHALIERRVGLLIGSAAVGVGLIALIGVGYLWHDASEIGRAGAIVEGVLVFGVPAVVGLAIAFVAIWCYRVSEARTTES